MPEFFATFWTAVVDIFTAFFQSKIFFGIKIFLAIYTAVVIVDVILLIYLGDVRKQLRQMRMGDATVKTAKRGEQKRWAEIMDRLDTDDEKQYRAAILEADHFVYQALEVQGYSGGNFAERITQIPAGSFMSQDAVRDVHTLSKKIIQDEKLRITKEQAKNALVVYEKFLKEIDAL
jgi:uncharacterized membrane protein